MPDVVPFLDMHAMHREILRELDAAWTEIAHNARFIGGVAVQRFEQEWASYCGTEHCVGVSDGTAAIKLALDALGIGRGDEVIVPANTFIATWEAVVAVGAAPKPVDVDPQTLLMTAEGIANAIGPRTAAIIAVHLFGQPMNMDAISKVAARAGIAVIEDAAQAHGATWKGRRAGSMSTIGCFSFYPGKNLGAFGDAGAVVTNDLTLADRIRSLANHGRQANAPQRHIYPGSNHRLDALQAAVLSVKLPRLDGWNERRRRAATRYRELLAGLAIDFPSVASGAVSNFHLAVLQVPDRDRVQSNLAKEGIATGIHYAIPCHRQPAFSRFAKLSMPVAEKAASSMLSLPMFPHLSEVQMQRVATALTNTVPKEIRSQDRRPRSVRPISPARALERGMGSTP